MKRKSAKRSTDPTLIRSQPALTSSRGAVWLIVGGLFAIIAVVGLLAMAVAGLPPIGVPLVAAIAVAALMLTMAAVALAAFLIVATAAQSSLP